LKLRNAPRAPKRRSISWITRPSLARIVQPIVPNGSITRSVAVALSPRSLWRTARFDIAKRDMRPCSVRIGARYIVNACRSVVGVTFQVALARADQPKRRHRRAFARLPASVRCSNTLAPPKPLTLPTRNVRLASVPYWSLVARSGTRRAGTPASSTVPIWRTALTVWRRTGDLQRAEVARQRLLVAQLVRVRVLGLQPRVALEDVERVLAEAERVELLHDGRWMRFE
jgi:hypothetical protein